MRVLMLQFMLTNNERMFTVECVATFCFTVCTSTPKVVGAATQRHCAEDYIKQIEEWLCGIPTTFAREIVLKLP